MSGLSDLHVDGPRAELNFLFIHLSAPLTPVVGLVTALIVLVVAGVPMLLILRRRQFPSSLEWFALASTCLVTAMFLWPSEFYYHFATFLAPFLALGIALPLAYFVNRHWATVAVAVVLAIFAVVEAQAVRGVDPTVPAAAITATERHIPPGSCVVSDTASLPLLANRFNSPAPGCTVMVDGLGTDLTISHGLTPETGAGAIPAVTRLWHQVISHTQYLWLSSEYTRRIPLTPALSRFVHRDFRLVYSDAYGDKLYRRVRS